MAALVIKRGGDPAKAVRLLHSTVALGTLVSRDVYADMEAEARKRLASRDPDDWPILAAALHPVPVTHRLPAAFCPAMIASSGFDHATEERSVTYIDRFVAPLPPTWTGRRCVTA